MLLQIHLGKKQKKELKKVEKQFKSKIITILKELPNTPYRGKLLEGDLKGCRSIRVWPYRIIYDVIEKDGIIKIIRIGHRQGVYKGLD